MYHTLKVTFSPVMDNYKPSKFSQTAIEKMMAKWRDDDQKLEMEERDRAKRSMIMKKKEEYLTTEALEK